MELANIMLRIGGENFMIVPKEGVTPAECVLLNELHAPQDRDAVTEIEIVDDVPRTRREEFERLGGPYRHVPLAKLRELFGPSGSNVPETFEDANLVEREAPAPTKVRRRQTIDLSKKEYAERVPTHKPPVEDA
jgi:hypothetical protein